MLARQELLSVIAKLHPRFLDGLTATQLNAVLAPAKVRTFKAHAYVTRENRAASHVDLVLHGRGRGYFESDGRNHTAALFSPGKLIGASAILREDVCHLLTAEAISEMTTLEWRHKEIRELAAAIPRLLDNGLYIAREYQEWQYLLLDASATKDAAHRLAKVLAHHARAAGVGKPAFTSNRDLAQAAAVSPYTASRFLTKCERDGIVAKRLVGRGRGQIVVLLPDALDQIEGMLPTVSIPGKCKRNRARKQYTSQSQDDLVGSENVL